MIRTKSTRQNSAVTVQDAESMLRPMVTIRAVRYSWDFEKNDLGRISVLWLNGESGLRAQGGSGVD